MPLPVWVGPKPPEHVLQAVSGGRVVACQPMELAVQVVGIGLEAHQEPPEFVNQPKARGINLGRLHRRRLNGGELSHRGNFCLRCQTELHPSSPLSSRWNLQPIPNQDEPGISWVPLLADEASSTSASI